MYIVTYVHMYVIRYEKSQLLHTITNFRLKCCISGKEVDACMQFAIILYKGQLLSGELAKLPTILDSFATDIANTTSTNTRVEGGEWWGATNWWA